MNAQDCLEQIKTRLILSSVINSLHFPELTNFPHHIHAGSETEVMPGRVMSVIALIDLLEGELSSPCS
jgi:hypothetical protein